MHLVDTLIGQLQVDMRDFSYSRFKQVMIVLPWNVRSVDDSVPPDLDSFGGEAETVKVPLSEGWGCHCRDE